MKVTPVLGFISVEGGTLDDAKPANNATRWIFNVEGGLSPDAKLIISLLEPRNKKLIKPDILSCSLLPLDARFYDAKPFVSPLNEGDPGTLALMHGGGLIHLRPEDAVIHIARYRVQVDIMHTATR